MTDRQFVVLANIGTEIVDRLGMLIHNSTMPDEAGRYGEPEEYKLPDHIDRTCPECLEDDHVARMRIPPSLEHDHFRCEKCGYVWPGLVAEQRAENPDAVRADSEAVSRAMHPQGYALCRKCHGACGQDGRCPTCDQEPLTDEGGDADDAGPRSSPESTQREGTDPTSPEAPDVTTPSPDDGEGETCEECGHYLAYIEDGATKWRTYYCTHCKGRPAPADAGDECPLADEIESYVDQQENVAATDLAEWASQVRTLAREKAEAERARDETVRASECPADSLCPIGKQHAWWQKHWKRMRNVAKGEEARADAAEAALAEARGMVGVFPKRLIDELEHHKVWWGADHDDGHSVEMWLGILNEEVSEVRSAAERYPNGEMLPDELADLAAVCISWMRSWERTRATTQPDAGGEEGKDG